MFTLPHVLSMMLTFAMTLLAAGPTLPAESSQSSAAPAVVPIESARTLPSAIGNADADVVPLAEVGNDMIPIMAETADGLLVPIDEVEGAEQRLLLPIEPVASGTAIPMNHNDGRIEPLPTVSNKRD